MHSATVFWISAVKKIIRSCFRLIEQREEELRVAPNRMFYLSVGPEFFETIAANIQESGLGSADGWKRLVIEKPFGHDLQSARDLNRNLEQSFRRRMKIFRIDHYLGKPMVQKLEILQQTNPVIQALWNNRYIANVQITANETVGVEERAGLLRSCRRRKRHVPEPYAAIAHDAGDPPSE